MKLNFVVDPQRESKVERIGNTESGVIEIERLGYLRVKERAFVQATMLESTFEGNPVRDVMEVIAAGEKIDVKDAGAVVQGFVLGSLSQKKKEAIAKKYGDQILSAFRHSQLQTATENLAGITALLMYRHDPNWTIEGTMELHPALEEGLTQLYLDEKNGSLSTIDNSTLQESTDIESSEEKKS